MSPLPNYHLIFVKLEPNYVGTNTENPKVLVGEGRHPRREEKEHQDKVKRKIKQRRRVKTQTHQPLPIYPWKKKKLLILKPIEDLFPMILRNQQNNETWFSPSPTK